MTLREVISIKPKIDDFFPLDIRKISKTFRITGSERTFAWSCPDTGGSIIFFDRANDLIEISYSYSDLAYSIRIPISRTRCHLGGERPWFHCPICNSRVAVLYIKGPPACRLCWGATYPSQCEDAQLRAWRRATKVRARLSAPTGLPAYLIPKPKGMHWETFETLIRSIVSFEAKGWEERPKWMRD